MSALLGARSLVFDVDSCSTTLNEELGEFHDGGETAMAGISIGNDGAQVVDIGVVDALLDRSAQAFLALFAVVEELCFEEVFDFGRDGVLSWIVQRNSQKQHQSVMMS
jgi:hypothetical protein